jgi:hypothetical protein
MKKCKKDKSTAEQAQNEAESTANEGLQEMAPVDAIQMNNSDSLLISYERTPCFGRCPVFKIKVYESGYTTYQGVNFVEYMGYFYTRIDASKLAEIKAAISASDFFSLEDRYDNEQVMDLPSKIYQVDIEGMNKRITARYQVPESLNILGQKMEKIFEGTAWQGVMNDH